MNQPVYLDPPNNNRLSNHSTAEAKQLCSPACLCLQSNCWSSIAPRCLLWLLHIVRRVWCLPSTLPSPTLFPCVWVASDFIPPQTPLRPQAKPYATMMQRVVPAVRAAATAAASNVRCMSTAFPSYLLNAPATEISTLNNGVRVASEVNPRLVSLWIASLHAALTRFVAFVLCPLLAATGWPRRDCHGWCLY